MAVTYFPFDAGSGSAITEASWQKMARRWLATGVITGYLNQLQVTADGTGMTVSVNTGAAWIEGFYGENDAASAQTITAAHATLSRIDRVVLRLDRTANTVAFAVLTGTAAASPVAPTLTTTDSLWEIGLATVLVDPAVGVIAANKVTDTRTLVKNLTEAAGSAAYVAKVLGSADSLAVTGLTGSVSASRYVGATASVAPTTGAHLLGDWVITQDGKIFICTVAGTPGTWVQVGGSAAFVGCRVTAPNQSIPNATETAVGWTAETYDTSAFHDNATNNSRFTVPSGLAGYYRLTASVTVSTNATGQRYIVIKKNGATALSYFTEPGSSVAAVSLILSDVLNLAVADYLEVFIFQASGGALTLNNVPENYATLQYLGA